MNDRVKSGEESGPNAADAAVPALVDREAFEEELAALRVREKAHMRQGDAVAAARRRLPMVEVGAATPLTGPDGQLTLLDAFEGRRILLAYYHMWYTGKPAPEQCEGCTRFTSQVGELSYLHDRDVTFAVLCQGPYDESRRYRDFLGLTMPWYSAEQSLETLLVGRRIGMFHLVSYLRDGGRVFETYWTNGRGAEAMDYSYGLLDLTPYGRQEQWEDSPAGRPQRPEYNYRRDGRPIAQWARIEAGRSDDLGNGGSPAGGDEAGQ
jgi:predicted dithiol-disulfide oxidoreductase (DUF899 family)